MEFRKFADPMNIGGAAGLVAGFSAGFLVDYFRFATPYLSRYGWMHGETKGDAPPARPKLRRNFKLFGR